MQRRRALILMKLEEKWSEERGEVEKGGRRKGGEVACEEGVVVAVFDKLGLEYVCQG